MMEEEINRLVFKLQNKIQTLPPSSRYLVAISGIPGSGKTILALAITAALNAPHYLSHPDAPPLAIYVPMDGFHLTRAELDALPNATEAHQRRGAPWTFDAAKLLSFVRALRALPVPADAAHAVEPLYAPSFDHAKKDPVERDIRIDPAARVVVLEGLYLSLGTGLWREICAEMDELWFVEADGEVARRRLVERHLLSGVARDREEAERRAGGSDALNAEEIVRDRLAVDEVVVSVEDHRWKEYA